MKQSILVGRQQSHVQEHDLPAVGAQDVLVRVKVCGVCASELHLWMEGEKCPHALGHEVVGEVIEVGSAVRSVVPGMRVTGLFHKGFAEFAVAEEDRVIPVPEVLTDEEALGEPLSCIISGARRTPVELGDKVAVVGVGFMGQLALQALRLRGAAHIIAIDVRDDALALAQRLGADEVMNPEAVHSEMKLLTMGQIGKVHGIDVVVEASGTQRGLSLASELVREHGVLSIVGYHQGGLRQVDMKMWNWKAIQVVNAHERRRNYQVDCMKRGLRLIESGRIDMASLISHRFGLQEVDEAFNALGTKTDGFVKAIIRPVWVPPGATRKCEIGMASE